MPAALPRLIGINHVALEVGDIDEALAFYGKIFRFTLRELAKAAGATMVDGPFLDFLDPWGNRIEVIAYANIQFSKAPQVLRGMAFDGDKSEKAKKELADKGMAP